MSGAVDLDFLDDAGAARRLARRRRARRALLVPGTFTVGWVAAVAATSSWDRVGAHWTASLTMVFGSLVAGATPQGGGAVAFPVFTKVLDVPADVARSFSLCIQTVGMGCAAASIAITRRRVAWRAVALCTPVACVCLVIASIGAGDRTQPFWPSRIPGPYVKVVFGVVLAAMALALVLAARVPVRFVRSRLPSSKRLSIALLVGGAVGGTLSALVGSGADVAVYVVIGVLVALDSRVGVATSVITMALVSAVGFVLFGLVDGQLFVELTADGSEVTSVGFSPVDDPLPADRFDLLGMWLAAVPVVCWGAPAGAWLASRMRRTTLLAVVVAFALLELVSTAIFLDELHSDPALVTFAVVALVAVCSGLVWLSNHSAAVLDLPRLEGGTGLRRSNLDAKSDLGQRLGSTGKRSDRAP